MKRNNRTVVAVVVFVVVALALIVYSTLRLGGYSCEVCIEFHGQSKCRTANGSTKEESMRTATDNACAFLSSGVTDTIACANTPPKSVRCENAK
jgi:hypothetical protein